ncbi:MAG: hypothetical protein KAV98_02970 [Dehalococcoidia bacterium]|nr:hypothetical protein [Dehalococcoidia bacterium]
MAFNVIHTPLKLIIHQQVLPLHFSRAEYLRVLAKGHFVAMAPPKAMWGNRFDYEKRAIHLSY